FAHISAQKARSVKVLVRVVREQHEGAEAVTLARCSSYLPGPKSGMSDRATVDSKVAGAHDLAELVDAPGVAAAVGAEGAEIDHPVLVRPNKGVCARGSGADARDF